MIKQRCEGKRKATRVLTIFIRFSLGLVSEQTSKMAKAWKAVCIWRRSPRAWHGLPVATPGAFFPEYFIPGDLSLGSRTWYYPGYLFLVLPGLSASYAVLSFRSSGCFTPPMPRPSGMPLFLQHVTSDRGHLLCSPSFSTWRGEPGIGCPTGAFGWNSKGDQSRL